MFEGLHEGRILCSAAADDNILLTGGESTVKLIMTKFWTPVVSFPKFFLHLRLCVYGRYITLGLRIGLKPNSI